jgi:hypothetical protein
MHTIPTQSWVLIALMGVLLSCTNRSDDTPNTANNCDGLAIGDCADAGCSWNPAAGACQQPNAGWTPCPSEGCPSPECAAVPIDGREVCILAPDCAGLPESECASTIGCVPITGKQAPVTPTSKEAYVGCGGPSGPTGATIACTAPDADGPCWVVVNWWAPNGWEFWVCPSTTPTHEECMSQGPYSTAKER